MTARWMQDVPTEEWRPIEGHPEYSVSSLGRIASRALYRGSRTERILAQSLSGAGYYQVGLTGGHTSLVHHLVAEAFIGPRPSGNEVRHLDGTRTSNVVENLAYGTRSDNVQDALRHGTHNNASKTHCKQGHPFDELNTAVRGGQRACRTCHAARSRRRRAAFREANPLLKRTHCRRGHPRNQANALPGGKSGCRACKQQKDRESYAAKKETTP